MSQYGIAQACNIMWLDGFYMLPLIMLGVYRVVNGGRPVMLSVSVALAVLFNWYMGGINCVFACFWFCLNLHIQDCTVGILRLRRLS